MLTEVDLHNTTTLCDPFGSLMKTDTVDEQLPCDWICGNLWNNEVSTFPHKKDFEVVLTQNEVDSWFDDHVKADTKQGEHVRINANQPFHQDFIIVKESRVHQLWEPTCLINLPEQVPEIELQDLSPTGSFSSDDQEGDSGSSSPRTKKRGRSNKKRFVWSAELHMHFVRAYETLGNNATPKKVMCRMKLNGAQMDGLTRIKVASHFQKYKLKKEKISTGNASNEMHGWSECDLLDVDKFCGRTAFPSMPDGLSEWTNVSC